MSVKIEIAKKHQNVSKERIEDVVYQLIESGRIFSNSIFKLPSKNLQDLNEIQDEIHSITTNHIPVS